MAPTQHPVREPSSKPFRSWGETQIGRMLDRYGVPYFYEHPLAVVDERGHTRIWYPDFQLRGYGMLIEYFGRVREPECAEAMARKRAIYQTNGITALLLEPQDLRGNWPGRLLGAVQAVLHERCATFRTTRGTQLGTSKACRSADVYRSNQPGPCNLFAD